MMAADLWKEKIGLGTGERGGGGKSPNRSKEGLFNIISPLAIGVPPAKVVPPWRHPYSHFSTILAPVMAVN